MLVMLDWFLHRRGTCTDVIQSRTVEEKRLVPYLNAYAKMNFKAKCSLCPRVFISFVCKVRPFGNMQVPIPGLTETPFSKCKMLVPRGQSP